MRSEVSLIVRLVFKEKNCQAVIQRLNLLLGIMVIRIFVIISLNFL